MRPTAGLRPSRMHMADHLPLSAAAARRGGFQTPTRLPRQVGVAETWLAGKL